MKSRLLRILLWIAVGFAIGWELSGRLVAIVQSLLPGSVLPAGQPVTFDGWLT